MNQSTDGLDHAEAVGCLDARSLKSIVKDRVLVSDEIELRGVFHDFDAHVTGVLVGEQRVEVVHETGQNAGKDRQAKFCSHQPPQAWLHWRVGRHGMNDGIDD